MRWGVRHMAEPRANPHSLTTSPPHHLVTYTGKAWVLYGYGNRWGCGEVVSGPATARVCGVSTLTTCPKVVRVGARYRTVPRGTERLAGPPPQARCAGREHRKSPVVSGPQLGFRGWRG